ncbi:MAG: YkgJ family cysteine cluster protein [Fluviicola sp.]|jgi:Fe-S-cluster containining protein
MFTSVSLSDSLPLTCARSGSCCHGNRVRLNPWELRQLATASGISVYDFLKRYTTDGGIFLRFKGKANQAGRKACNLYVENLGCSVHPARPLACRLFPLGRVIQNGEATYMHLGKTFPCLSECAEVLELPQMTVESYLSGQETTLFERAQDAYLEVLQNLADVALTLLLDTELVERIEFQVLLSWEQLGKATPTVLADKIGEEWLQHLLKPNLPNDLIDPDTFVQVHSEQIMQAAQILCDQLSTVQEIYEASILMMTMALFLAHAVGADAAGLSEWWVQIAKENGAEA